ncbi:DUF6193 family natural product biosynthesis protein [Streptomyces sp. YS-3]|uniref:DUF6193 family natural product biosynthesis protein n=1 Tax=Streptomyces sp. YS-3 TaxID=3381352 RepID=UPI0038629B3A
MNSPGSTEAAGSPRDPRLEHYADLIEHGGLQAAIVSIAREQGVDLGATESGLELEDPAWSAAQFSSPRGMVRIHLGRGTRRFGINLDSGQGFVWASGSTTDLSEVAGVLILWRQGVKLRELSSRFPFMGFDRLSQAYEDGNPVETQWDILMGDDSFLAYRELLSALHADPHLSRMFPFFSHWTLRLAKDCHDVEAGELWVQPSPEEGYVVWSSSDEDRKLHVHQFDDLIRTAVAMLDDL